MKKCAAILLLYFVLTVVSGCGQSMGESIQSTEMPFQAGNVSAKWKQEGFAAQGEPEEGQALWAGQYLPVKHAAGSADTEAKASCCLDHGVYGKLFWHLCTVRGAGGGIGVEYVLEIYDTANGESAIKRFTPEEMGLAGELCFFDSMDMPDETHYVFRWVDYEQDGEGMYRQTQDKIVYTDLAGNFQAVDFWESYLEKGIEQEKITDFPLLQIIDWRCDGEGNIYVIKSMDNGSFQLCLFDSKGELILEKEGAEKQLLSELLRTSDGELIFPVYDYAEKCYEFLWADITGRQLCCLGRMEASYPDIYQMYGMLGNDIYYRSRKTEADGIVKWDVVSGRRELLFDLREAGLNTGYEILLALREGQPPVSCLSRYIGGERKEWLMTFQEQKPTDSAIVRVADLTVSGESKELVKSCAATASLESPAFNYAYEDASAEESRDRILAELTQGKGPDLLLVSLEDMHMLAEKGVLLDIKELIAGGLREELLPGALEIGTVDGTLYGMPPAVVADTLVAAADVWPHETWRLEDVINLMEEGKLTCAVRYRPDFMRGEYMEPLSTVISLVRYSLEDSFLIDWENRKCHFDDDRFIRLLELCSTDMSGVPVEQDVWLNGGKGIVWGYFSRVEQLFDFLECMEVEGGQSIGYPTEGVRGSYLVAEGGVLVVNANADVETAGYFLETLLGKEIQSKTQIWSMSVRRPSQEDYVIEESGRLLFKNGDGSGGREVLIYSDGDTSFHRAKAFLESCAAPPPCYSQISKILYEEISAMYAEGRSPETTAGIINSRVQIYLDEGN